MTTLFDLAYRVAVAVGGLQEGTATGGSTTTLIDTAGLADLDNDLFNGGSVFIPKSTDGAAPQGQYGIVSDFVGSSKTVTLKAAMTAAIQAGDVYALSKSRYPLHKILQSINQVLATVGKVPVEDTSLVTVIDQRVYTLPAAASMDLRQVWLETDSDNDLWLPIYDWDILYTAGGAAEQIRINHDFGEADETIKLVYVTTHSQMRTYSDTLNEVIHPDRIIYKAAANLITEFVDRTRQAQYIPTRDRLLDEHARAMATTPAPRLPRKAWYKNVWQTDERWYTEAL